ncbi:polyprenyl synthetase family protein [Pseudomonas sp. FH1]|uniref:polyprenyl synthetase family protein n=1 Tax=Pseudomonas sp. FH1 TaxID=1284392 RepID=UPI0003DC2BB2|nr:polyprenyl synthetase family protein [Pseudomonas sp. FH1]ETK24840.1 polyprenyl synthetase [Pseudomonas sp. FH1]
MAMLLQTTQPHSTLLLQMLESDFSSSSTFAQEYHLAAGFWNEALLDPARTFFRTPGKGFRASLVNLGWHLAGREECAPPELAIILEALHGGSLIVDDIEDNSSWRRGKPALHVTHGLPLALNTGNWLYFWALSLIQRLGLPGAVELKVSRAVSSTLLHCHSGQALDLSVRLTDLEQAEVLSVVSVISGLKTGRLMALAASLGAIAAGGSKSLVESLTVYGQQVGVALQMLDDLGNFGEQLDPIKRYEDLRNDRPSWVWAWLAEDLSCCYFNSLKKKAQAVVEPYEVQSLADDICQALGARGTQRSNNILDQSFRELCIKAGPHQGLDEARQQLTQLRASFIGSTRVWSDHE